MDSCQLSQPLPLQDFFVYAGGAYSGKKLDIVIDDSGHQATQMDVLVNETQKPVALILAAYEPTVWQVKWTRSTKIIAVFVSGYYEQRVSGLPDNIPVIINNNGYKCPNISYIAENKLSQINPLSLKLFNRRTDMVFFATNGVLNIGRSAYPHSDDAFIQENAQSSNSFRKKDSTLAGIAGLEEAVRNGIIRPATTQDLKRVISQMNQNKDLPPTQNGKVNHQIPSGMMHNAYVVLKPFQIPAGLYGAHSATFILERGVPRPTGQLGHSRLYDLNFNACSGVACNRE